MNEQKAKQALIKAIREFFTQEDILESTDLEGLAKDFVYDNDTYIKNTLADKVDFDNLFESILDDLDFYEIW